MDNYTELDKYIDDQYRYTLHSIDFKTIKEVREGTEMMVSDALTKINLYDNEMSFFFQRSLFFKPDSQFELVIIYEIRWRVKNEYVGEVPWKDIDVQDDIMENQEKYLLDIAGQASLMISQITNATGAGPIITPPVTLFDESNF